MVSKLHNLPLSAGHECTGCLEAIVQGAVLYKGGGEEGRTERKRMKQKMHNEEKR